MTGGGFPENIPRVVPKGLAARIRRSAWEVPALFQWLQEVRRGCQGGLGWGPTRWGCACMCGRPSALPRLTAPARPPPQPDHRCACAAPCPPQAGKVPDAEMFRTFNMGVGMIIVVPRADVDKVLGLGIGAFELGEIVQGSGVELV